MPYPKYNSYKKSGVQWLGDIPEEWEVNSIKTLFFVNRGRVIPNTDLIPNGRYPVYSSQTENNGVLGYIDTYDFDGEYISWTTDGVYAGTTFFRKGKFNATNICGLLKLQNNDFLNYYSHLFSFIIPLNKRPDTNGAKIMSNEMKSIICIRPSKPEQKKIAEFLDYKVGLIDEYVAKKRKMIELLGERKQAVINEAVCHGLDKSAPTKPSGIDWLGNIPKHWEVRKLKYVGLCQNGISAGADYFGSGHPFISYGDVYNNISLPLTASGLANSSIEERVSYSVEKGDIFFTRTSETIEEIGLTSTCLETIENAIFSGFIIRFRPFEKLLFEGYSKYFFRSQLHRNYFVKEMNIVTRASLNQDLLKNFLILIPPVSEQKQISDYLNEESGKIDLLISRIEKQIALMEEYKTALISEAVTGKIDVREYEIKTDNLENTELVNN